MTSLEFSKSVHKNNVNIDCIHDGVACRRPVEVAGTESSQIFLFVIKCGNRAFIKSYNCGVKLILFAQRDQERMHQNEKEQDHDVSRGPR